MPQITTTAYLNSGHDRDANSRQPRTPSLRSPRDIRSRERTLLELEERLARALYQRPGPDQEDGTAGSGERSKPMVNGAGEPMAEQLAEGRGSLAPVDRKYRTHKGRRKLAEIADMIIDFALLVGLCAGAFLVAFLLIARLVGAI